MIFLISLLLLYFSLYSSEMNDVIVGPDSTFSSDIWQHNPKHFDPHRVQALRDLLYPNHTRLDNDYEIFKRRKLQYNPRPSTTPNCVTCGGLSTCSILNGNQIEETYYPDSSQNTGGNNENTCSILENLGKRVKLEIFGTSKSFRDTETCKSMVMQYLCLFWGSDNRMYRNLCVWFEDVTNEDINLHVIAPRPPCRSFCVQVAEVCANDHHFLQLCYDIECPPEIDDCEPDPKVPNNGGLTPLDAGLGCNIPFAEDPYNSRNPATSLNHIGYKNLYYFTTLILGIIFSYLT